MAPLWSERETKSKRKSAGFPPKWVPGGELPEGICPSASPRFWYSYPLTTEILKTFSGPASQINNLIVVINKLFTLYYRRPAVKLVLWPRQTLWSFHVICLQRRCIDARYQRQSTVYSVECHGIRMSTHAQIKIYASKFQHSFIINMQDKLFSTGSRMYLCASAANTSKCWSDRSLWRGQNVRNLNSFCLTCEVFFYASGITKTVKASRLKHRMLKYDLLGPLFQVQ